MDSLQIRRAGPAPVFVIFRSAIFLLLSATAALAEGDWRQTLSPAAPGNFPACRPVRLSYNFGWAGLKAGRAEATISQDLESRLRLDVKGITTGLVRLLWRLDARHTALADAETLMPVSVRQFESYRAESIRTELDFTGEGVTKFREIKPGDSSPPKREPVKFRNIRDMFSALLYVRSQRLRQGDVLNFTVYPEKTPYLVKVRVCGREPVEVPAGKFNAIKLELKLWVIHYDSHLEPHPKCKRVIIWVSDDADRLPLKAHAEIFIGNVWAELEKAKFLKGD